MVKTVTVAQQVLELTIRVARGDPSKPAPDRYQKHTITLQAKGDHLIYDGVEKRILVIGRDPGLQKSRDIFVKDPSETVSGKHGYFFVKDGRFYYFDNNSVNGSLIKIFDKKGTLLKEVLLKTEPGEQAKGYEIKADKTAAIELGRWSAKGNGKFPIVQVQCRVREEVETPHVIQVAEMVATYQTPEGGTHKKMYVVQVLANNYLQIHHIKDVGEDVFPPAHQLFVGREVAKSDIVVPQFEGTTMRVSKVHGAFLVKDGFLFYQDLNSTNGSFFNDEKLAANAPHVVPKGYTKIGLGRAKDKKYPALLEINLQPPKAEATAIPIKKAA